MPQRALKDIQLLLNMTL